MFISDICYSILESIAFRYCIWQYPLYQEYSTALVGDIGRITTMHTSVTTAFFEGQCSGSSAQHSRLGHGAPSTAGFPSLYKCCVPTRREYVAIILFLLRRESAFWNRFLTQPSSLVMFAARGELLR